MGKEEILGRIRITLLIILASIVSVKSQNIERHLLVGKHDTVQALLVEDIIFYVRDCSKDSVLKRVDGDIFMIDANGNQITEYYEAREPSFKDFAKWLGKKYFPTK